MLDYKETLIFPKLRYIQDAEFHYRDGKIQTIPLYSLDWSYKDLKCKAAHQKWLSTSWPGVDVPFMTSLPQKYDEWITNLTFALSYDYKKEIIRNARQSVEEWNIKRSFDTNVREQCLSPAIEHVYVAFYLLSDCVYDKVTNYFNRSKNDFLIKYCLSYKFWSYQTGRGCRRGHSHISELEYTDFRDRDLGSILQEFLNELREYESNFDDMYDVIYQKAGLKNKMDEPINDSV